MRGKWRIRKTGTKIKKKVKRSQLAKKENEKMKPIRWSRNHMDDEKRRQRGRRRINKAELDWGHDLWFVV